MKLYPILIIFVALAVVCCDGEEHAFQSITDELKKHFDIFEGKISWMVQKKNGKILIKEHLHEEGEKPYDDNSSIHIASGCKWPAMTVIMKLVEEGILNLDDPISKFYTENEFSKEAQKITLLQLMTHQSGYGYVDEWIAFLQITLKDSVLGIARGGTVGGKDYPKDELVNVPGTTVLYGDIGMQIAGAIAEKASKKLFNQLYLDYIANPLGMKDTRFCAFDGDDGINIAIADGLYIRMIDYANFMLMLMNEGTFNGKQILKPETVKAILKDYTKDLKVHPTNQHLVSSDGKLHFGIGHWIINDGTYHSSNGIHSFYNYFDSENNYLGIFFLRTEDDEKTDDLFDNLTDKIEKIVLEEYADDTLAAPITKVKQLIFLLFVFIISFI